MSLNIFEKASRLKLRVSTARGELSVEQLWDLSLNTLDTIAISLQDELQSKQSRSLLAVKRVDATHAQLRFDIVKHILEYRVSEKERKEQEIVRQQEIEKIETFLARKADEKLETASEEELLQRLKQLKG